MTHALRATLVLALFTSLPTRAENWPQFRGPGGQARSAEPAAPTKWSATENLAWKTPVDGEGWSSPIVWDKHVFLTATRNKGTTCHVIALDRDTGKVLFDVQVFEQPVSRKQAQNSYATPTPVTDGKHVYAFFASGGAAALAFDGKTAWTYTPPEPFYSQHGLGASPILFEDMLILPWDHSIRTGPELRVGWQIPWDKSFVLVLDKNTGKEKSRLQRGMTRIAHVTPTVAEVGGKPQLLSPAGDAIEAFDPATGQRLWWVEQGGEGVTPSPAVGGGMIFASSGFPTALPNKPVNAALRAWKLTGGQGDVSKATLAWEHTKSVPMLASPLYVDGLLYLVANDGTLQCLNAADGKVLYTEKLKGKYAPSPVYAAGHVYLTSTDGNTTVIAAGREFKEVAHNEVGEMTNATLAISGGLIIQRTEKHVYAFKR